MISIDPSTSVICLHPPSTSAPSFVQRLLSLPSSSKVPTPTEFEYQIDNKYYKAKVQIRCFATQETGEVGGEQVDEEVWRGVLEDVAVVIWAFGKKTQARPPPALLQALSTLQPDIQIAVHLATPPSALEGEGAEVEGDFEEAGEQMGRDEMDEMFANLGMDFVDEEDVEGEESDLSPYETVLQSIQTHLWPNMTRKPSNFPSSSSHLPRQQAAIIDNDDDEPSFPVSFAPLPDAPLTVPELTARMGRMNEAAAAQAKDDEATEEGGTAIVVEEEEFVILDDWLNLDDAAPSSSFAGSSSPGFDDSFSPFQSAPTASSSKPVIPEPLINPELDPAPLFSHLQSVRAELSTLTDDDERRRRAAKEVERVLGSLGFGDEGGLDLDDWGFEESEIEVLPDRKVRTGMEMDPVLGLGREVLEDLGLGDLDGAGGGAGGGEEVEDLAELMKALGMGGGGSGEDKGS